MKTLIAVIAVALVVAVASPGHAFIDYLFGGSATSDAIDNSWVGDLRAWWTGNPAYQFNPYYSGNSNPTQRKSNAPPPQQQGYSVQQFPQSQGSYQPQPQPSVTYRPPQNQQYGYNQGGQPMQYSTQPQPQYYQQPQQQYQVSPQQYQQQSAYQQQAPQYYQQQPAQYQGAPQAYPGGYQR